MDNALHSHEELSTKTPLRETINREKFVAKTYINLLARNFGKYGRIASLLYFVPTLGMYPAMKPAYFFCRTLDDIADGDAQLPQGIAGFDHLIQHLTALIEGKGKPVFDIDFLLLDAIKKIKTKTTKKDIIEREFMNFIHAMQTDYDRRTHQESLSKDEINTLYDHSFSQVINLALIGLGSRNRIDEIGSLGRVQGKVYAIQDLEHELGLGIINIPQEVIAASGLDKASIIQHPNMVSKNAVVSQRIKDDLSECKNYIEDLKGMNLDKMGRRMVDFLVSPLKTFIKKYSVKEHI